MPLISVLPCTRARGWASTACESPSGACPVWISTVDEKTHMKAKPNLLAILFVLLAMSASAAVRYVDVNNSNPTAPYTTWATASATIQDAIDAAETGDEIVATNGVYQT